MKRHTQVGRADLLACLRRGDEARFERLAGALGYVLRPEPTKPRPPRSGPAPGRATTPSREVTPPTTAPRGRFFRVTAQRRLKADEVVDEPPEWFRRAEVLRVPERDPNASPPAQPPLMRWSRLWPFLKAALGATWTTKEPDLPRLVGLLARGIMLRELPYKQRQGWAGSAQLILDFAAPLVPFWTDFNATLARIRQLRGGRGLRVLAFPDGDPGGECWSWEGRDWRAIERYPAPAAGTPVLVLGDLGCIDTGDLRRRRWRRLGLQLRRARCRAVALTPCPPRWWDAELAGLFFSAPWDRAARLPKRIEGGVRSHLPASRAERDTGAETLLAVLSPAVRVEPALLRAVRHCLPASEVDAGSEAAAWTHPRVHASALAFRFDSRAIAHYRERNRKLDPGLRRQVRALVARHHACLSPAIGHEEHWLAAELEGRDVAGAARRFSEGLVKALRSEGVPELDAMRAWARRMATRQHPEVWRSMQVGEVLSAAWAAANLPAIRAGETPALPEGLELGRVSWLLAGERRPSRYRLRQRGEALVFESEHGPSEENGLDAPGSPLADVFAAADLVRVRRTEAEADAEGIEETTSALSDPVELPPRGQVQLSTDRQELTVQALPRPEWAEDIGRDEHGLYAGFRVEGVYQRMRWIAPGEFLMGSPPGELEREDDETQHPVTLTGGLWLADTACTQALWQAAMHDNPSAFEGDERPVEQVSWDEVQAFIEALNGRVPGGAFRLPTEAEWEYACRAGTTTPFWFGEGITSDQANYDGNRPYAGGQKGEYRKQTVPVKALPCNGWGLYQMHGNVWEWCADWYGAYPSDAAVDPARPDGGGSRVLRGGSWILVGRHLRSASRHHALPAHRDGIFGFRLARGRAKGS